jgi:hypothetical protein
MEGSMAERGKRRRWVDPTGLVWESHPSSIVPGGVTYVVGRQTPPAEVRAQSEAKAARLHRKRVEQKLNTIQQELAEASKAATGAVTETVVIPPPPVRITEAERVAAALRVLIPPHGIVPKGMVWDSVDRELRKLGVITSERSYWRALKLNREPVPGVPGLAR